MPDGSDMREAGIVNLLDQTLRSRGWDALDGIQPAGWLPDLVVTDRRGILLCIEVRLGRQPLHSHIVQTLSRAQEDLTNSWPGRSIVALVSSNPTSKRLESLLASAGIIFVRLSSASSVEDSVTRLLDMTTRRMPGPLNDVDDLNRATVAIEEGDWELASQLYDSIAKRQAEALGPAHPVVLETKYRLASLLSRAGHKDAARRIFEDLLGEQLQVLGPDHHSTLASRYNLANVLAQQGDVVRAAALYEQLLTDQLRVLGPDHPNTLTSRNNLANVLAQQGDVARAAALYEQLLTDQLRILGPDHPDTRSARGNLAHWRGEANNQ